MNVTLRQLEIFLAVAQREHVGRAAEVLQLAQSAVSAAIAELGRLLGGPLVERAGRRIALTERGRRLVPVADDLVRRAEDLELRFRSGGRLAGSLRLGASSTIGTYLLPRIIGEFAVLHPEVQIELTVGNSAAIEAGLVDRSLDLAFVEGPPMQPSLAVTAWRTDRLVVFAAPIHPLARCRVATLDQLAAQRWVVREPGSGTRLVFDAALRSAGIAIDVGLQLGNSEAVKLAVGSGLGLGCLSELAIARELARGELRAVRTPDLQLERTLWQLQRRYGHASDLALAFAAAAAGGAAKG
jgi:DNA-binding transcriptional LysR family regulator